jgi:hypothetical protein
VSGSDTPFRGCLLHKHPANARAHEERLFTHAFKQADSTFHPCVESLVINSTLDTVTCQITFKAESTEEERAELVDALRAEGWVVT